MLSIVIPTIGRTNLYELLTSIPSSPFLISVIVVEDNLISSRASEVIGETLRSCSHIPAKRVRAQVSGVNAARNFGICEAALDPLNQILLFLDDDVVLPDSFSWEAVYGRFTDPAILAVGGNYLSRSGADLLERGYNLMCNGWRVASGIGGNEALLGGAWCIRLPELLQVCQSLGWFEEEIQYGGAETPFVHRLRRWANGSWKIVYDMYFDVIHAPRGRGLGDWLKTASLQSHSLDDVTKMTRPAFAVRLQRLFGFCRSLSAFEFLVFSLFTIPFVVAGKTLSFFNNGQK